ncbi:hypothetical protein [Streptomyces sp. NPDC056049]
MSSDIGWGYGDAGWCVAASERNRQRGDVGWGFAPEWGVQGDTGWV